MAIYKLYKNGDDKVVFQNAYLESVYDEIRKDLKNNTYYKLVSETYKGGFKIVAGEHLFWLSKTVMEDDELIMFRDQDNEEWYRIEKTKTS